MSNTDRSYEQAIVERDQTARALFRAELALHDAHQTHVDAWINAANDRLHDAIARHEAANALVFRRHDHAPAA
jgi:hypothetical protein